MSEGYSSFSRSRESARAVGLERASTYLSGRSSVEKELNLLFLPLSLEGVSSRYARKKIVARARARDERSSDAGGTSLRFSRARARSSRPRDTRARRRRRARGYNKSRKANVGGGAGET